MHLIQHQILELGVTTIKNPQPPLRLICAPLQYKSAMLSATSQRVGDGARHSTPGRGVAQWTPAPGDSTFYNTGAPWSVSALRPTNPLPGQQHMLSDISHRRGERTDVSNNRRTFGTSIDADEEAAHRRDQMVAARRAAAEARVKAMVGGQGDYKAIAAAETRAAIAAQEDAKRGLKEAGRQAEAATSGHARALQVQQENLIADQHAARRVVQQQVAREQLAQMEARQAAQAAERAADRAAAKAGADGTGWHSRFGTSLA